MAQTEILLESGTNEVEILEFNLGSVSYGINVLKIKHIMEFKPENLIKPPLRHESVIGGLDVHGQVVPIIDLRHFFNVESESDDKTRIVIMTEFNKTRNGFLIDGVNQIHRVGWEVLQPVESTHTMEYVVAVAIVNNRNILIPDFEKTVDVIFQGSGGGFAKDAEAVAEAASAEDETKHKNRSDVRIFCADDSSLIRKHLRTLLEKHQYTNISIFGNGQTLYDHIMEQKSDSSDAAPVDIVITDIEMPMLDGLSLCKRLKREYPRLPVIILSSMIDDSIVKRCEAVHADDALSKKDIDRLVPLLDEACISKHDLESIVPFIDEVLESKQAGLS